MQVPSRNRITIAILALGGQGGGVLADWLVHLASQNGYLAQSTSVPGVAQRTGSTIYYLELFPEHAVAGGAEPVLALMPVPGDVDLVVASELMEGGRAILRGLVSRDRTTLVTSTHRVYAISEKSGLGGPLNSGSRIVEKAALRAKRLVAFDMEDATVRSGSVISSVMFGAIAASGALPFARAQFEAAIRAGGIAIDRNLIGFAAGFEAAGTTQPVADPLPGVPEPTSAAGIHARHRVWAELPEPAHAFALEGVRRLMDYQDAAYAGLYLDRLARVKASDRASFGWALTREAARHLALWMSFEDSIRIADLKIRGARLERVHTEVGARGDQLVQVTEYMHPRYEEICDTLPAGLGARLLGSARARRLSAPLLREGRHVTTTNILWFMLLRTLAGLRRWRPGTLRYTVEQRRIQEWLELIETAATSNLPAALRLVECQRLVRGYGDTHARGLRSFETIVAAYAACKDDPDIADTLDTLLQAALADEEGVTLRAAVEQLTVPARALQPLSR